MNIQTKNIDLSAKCKLKNSLILFNKFMLNFLFCFFDYNNQKWIIFEPKKQKIKNFNFFELKFFSNTIQYRIKKKLMFLNKAFNI